MISLLNKFDDKYIIKEKDILEIALFYLKNNNLDNLLKDISFDNKNDSMAFYDLDNNNIMLNDAKIWKFCYKNVDNIMNMYHVNKEYYTYFLNYYYISVLFHELTHAIQKKKYENSQKDSLYVYLYDLCRLLQYSNVAFYSKNHDLLPLEIDANNNGFLNAYQLMTYTKLPNKETRVMHLLYLNSLLSNYKKLSNYKVLTPMDKLQKKNPMIDVEEIYNLLDKENLSKIERLNYGLDITPREYDGLNRERCKILLKR